MKKAYGLEITQSLEDALRPDTCALVVYDMQEGILRQLPHAPQVLDRVLRVLAAARGCGMRVFFMRHMSLPAKLAGRFQLRQAMAWQRAAEVEAVSPWFLRDSPGFALSPALRLRDDEAVFDKIGMSAFEGTPLATALRDCGMTSFLIVGIATEIGIDPTVRQGADLGFVPIVATDACGHGDPASAERTIDNMRHMGDAFLTTVAEVEAVLHT